MRFPDSNWYLIFDLPGKTKEDREYVALLDLLSAIGLEVVS